MYCLTQIVCPDIGDLTEYYRAVEAMDMSSSDIQPKLPKHPSYREPEQKPGTESVPKKVYKPKPFSEIVRLQRPEATRKKVNQYALELAQRTRYVSETDTVNTSARAQVSQREKEMIYGKYMWVLPTANKVLGVYVIM